MEMMQLEASMKAQGKPPAAPPAGGRPNLQAVQAQTIRPTEGDVRRGTDMKAGILGPARNRQ